MNERIKDLIEQATESKGFLTAGDSVPPLPVREFNKEKFAELIVRECARIARNTDLEDVEGGDSAVLRAAGEQIKQHFGVEE